MSKEAPSPRSAVCQMVAEVPPATKTITDYLFYFAGIFKRFKYSYVGMMQLFSYVFIHACYVSGVGAI